MKFLQYLKEKYYDIVPWSFLGKKIEVPIFVNPTSSEIKELPNDIRFLADTKKKDVYVWDAEVIHSSAMPQNLLNQTTTLDGTAKKLQGKIIMVFSDQLNYMLKRAEHYPEDQYAKEYILRRSWIWEKNIKWIDRYVNVSGWIERNRKSFNKIRKANV